MRRRFLLSVLTLALGLGVGVGVVEVGLRLSGFSNPVTSRRDDYCGTIRRPGVEYLQADEGRALVRFNAAGFRDEEWTLAKPADTFRIAVLGDSYVEAVQVALGDRFTEVLERELDGTPAVGGRRVHVLTFGVSGFGTAQELMCLRHHVWQYSPDLVILAVTTGNDLRNNSRALQNDDGRPYFAYVNGSLTLDTSFRQSAAHRRSARRELALAVIERSRAAQAAYRFWQNRSSLARRVRIRDAARATQVGEEAGLDTWAYMESTEPLEDHGGPLHSHEPGGGGTRRAVPPRDAEQRHSSAPESGDSREVHATYRRRRSSLPGAPDSCSGTARRVRGRQSGARASGLRDDDRRVPAWLWRTARKRPLEPGGPPGSRTEARSRGAKPARDGSSDVAGRWRGSDAVVIAVPLTAEAATLLLPGQDR